MKTNIILNSPDRELFGYIIRQETKTSFLNLSNLQEAYTRLRIKNNWGDKQLQDILQQKENSERIYYILKKRELINTDFNVFMENVENKGLIKHLKQLGVYKTIGARKNKTTWCNQDIFVLLAMELNPMLYAEVVCWLSDRLICNRIEAGDFYKDLTRSVYKLKNVDYMVMAKSLNYKIFGRHESGIRNLATKEQLHKMQDLENKIAFAIDMNYITSFDDVIKAIKNYKIG